MEVHTAANGRECLDLVLAERPGILILDLNMPEMNGLEVLQHLKEEKISPYIIVLTADIQDSTRDKCRMLGASAILLKPVDREALQETLEQAAAQGGDTSP
jgi:CheY-like chemotaxis protein